MLGALFMSLVVVLAHHGLVQLCSGWSGPAKIWQVASVLGSITAGAASYFLLAFLLKVPEVDHVLAALRRRIRK